MKKSLPRRQGQLIKTQLQRGHCASAPEVFREALQLMDAIEAGRGRIQMALDEADLEPAVPVGKNFWRDLRRRVSRDPA